MEGCSSQNSGPELASSIPPPSTPLCQPHKVLQGREIAPIHVLQTAPPAPKSLPNPTCIPCIPPVGAKPGGGARSQLSQAGSWLSPSPPGSRAGLGGRGESSQKLPGRRARGIAERAQAHGDRQTDTGRKETPPPYSTLARAEASPAQSEGGRQIQSAMSSCCCRCRWRTADV